MQPRVKVLDGGEEIDVAGERHYFCRLDYPVVSAYRPGLCLSKKVAVFDTFVDGAKEGFPTFVRLIPFLVAMLVAIGVLRASGALELLLGLLMPLLTVLNIPPEIVPLALMRPLSGSGSLALTTEILQTSGPDSLIGRIASTMQGSTDTTLFVLTLYFGSVGIRQTRHVLPVGLFADLAGFIAAVIVCKLVFA